MSKVLCFGTFDGVHKGHLEMLRQAKALGDFLAVAVAPDKVVWKIKNKAPAKNAAERAEALKKEGTADKVIMADAEINSWRILDLEQPDIIALGYDQHDMLKSLEAHFSSIQTQDRPQGFENTAKRPRIVILKPYKPKVFKSSKLNKLIQ